MYYRTAPYSSGTLLWNTFLGGSDTDSGRGIALDSSGNIFVAGYSSVTWGSPIRAHSSDADAFVAKLEMMSYAVNASVTGGNGSVSPATQTVHEKQSAFIDITPDTGYEIASITDNGNLQTITNPYVINNVQENHDVVVTFTLMEYNVSASVSGGNGTVDPVSQVLSHVDTASIDIFPDTGFEIAFIVDNGSAQPIANPYVINNVSEDHNVVVIFRGITFRVNAAVSGGNGSVSPASQIVEYGDNASITISPAPGYEIASITDKGISRPVASPYIINNVTEVHNVVVTFRHITYPPSLTLTGTRKTERAWIISKDYTELNISITEHEYPMVASAYTLFKKVNGTWVGIKNFSGPGSYEYSEKFIKSGESVSYKLAAIAPDGTVITESTLTL